MLQFAVEDPVILHELIAAKNCIYLPPLDVNKTGSKLPKFTSYLLFDIQILFLHDRLRFETDLHDLITYFIQLGTGLDVLVSIATNIQGGRNSYFYIEKWIFQVMCEVYYRAKRDKK